MIAELTVGQLNALVKKLGGVKTVKDILSDAVEVEMTVLDHVVNGNADPFVPDGWKVEEHKKHGDMKITREGEGLFINGKKIDFYLSEGQQNGKYIKGDKLRKELDALPVLNANVLDYLCKHPELIPESWKNDASGNTRYIFFWGTVYRRSAGDLCVRCLGWVDGAWYWSDLWLGRGWGGDDPSAVLAS
ncbi:MAG: hypothetical protein M3Q73_02470 [bacterium]|nr:hypothetical protein [bacterium]